MSAPAPRRRRDPERTRAAIIDAVLAALDAGDVAPTAKFIAQRAEVSERSIFVHFNDLDEIRVAAALTRGVEIDAIMTPISSGDPLEQRIDALVSQRERMYPLQTGIRVAELIHAHRSPDLSSLVRLRHEQLRAQVVDTLSPEVDGQDSSIVDALDAVFDWAFRHQLVTRQGLDQVAASQVVRATALNLLQ